MKVKRSKASGAWYAVFKSEYNAELWWPLWGGFFRRRMACYGGYYNAYYLFGGK